MPTTLPEHADAYMVFHSFMVVIRHAIPFHSTSSLCLKEVVRALIFFSMSSLFHFLSLPPFPIYSFSAVGAEFQASLEDSTHLNLFFVDLKEQTLTIIELLPILRSFQRLHWFLHLIWTMSVSCYS